ncbi:MAG: hypothetical protein PHP17_03280, partial [Candidatus Omnitrophica bacterium]|nr:hypothetical protein [Candidatus Omnitrophota bacterium]
ARNINVYIDTQNGAKPLGLIGRKGEVSEKYLKTEISALYGKNEKYALFEMQIPKALDGASKQVANVRVEYTDPVTGKTIKTLQKISVQYSKNSNLVVSRQDSSILKETALTKTSEIKDKAIKLADEGKYDAAADYLNQQSATLEKVAKQCNNDKDVKQEAERCSWLSGNIFSNKGFSRELRKSVVSEAYSQTNQQQYAPGKERK